MSEKQKTLITLKLALDTTQAALAFLANPDEHHDPALDNSNLPVLHNDFISLLSLIHGSVTKVALVLKPSNPSYVASLEPLKDLTNRVAGLPHSVRLLQSDHGKTLATEAANTAKKVLEAIQSLIQTFISIDSEGSSSTGQAGDEYMVRTGAIHDIIDKARAQDGFSRNNAVAVCKIWKQNQESLDDGLHELRGMLENSENTTEGDEIIDDGWGELGIDSNIKPTVTETGRIKKIHAIVRLSTLFHQKLLREVLSPLSSPSSISKETNVLLDNIAQSSSDFLDLSDNFISTIYPPQVPEHIKIELEVYKQQLELLQSQFDPLIPGTALEERLKNLHSSSKDKNVDYAKLRKWYTACINQINKNINELEDELKGQETPLV